LDEREYNGDFQFIISLANCKIIQKQRANYDQDETSATNDRMFSYAHTAFRVYSEREELDDETETDLSDDYALDSMEESLSERDFGDDLQYVLLLVSLIFALSCHFLFTFRISDSLLASLDQSALVADVEETKLEPYANVSLLFCVLLSFSSC
jgi:hypothetical protein